MSITHKFQNQYCQIKTDGKLLYQQPILWKVSVIYEHFEFQVRSAVLTEVRAI